MKQSAVSGITLCKDGYTLLSEDICMKCRVLEVSMNTGISRTLADRLFQETVILHDESSMEQIKNMVFLIRMSIETLYKALVAQLQRHRHEELRLFAIPGSSGLGLKTRFDPWSVSFIPMLVGFTQMVKLKMNYSGLSSNR